MEVHCIEVRQQQERRGNDDENYGYDEKAGEKKKMGFAMVIPMGMTTMAITIQFNVFTAHDAYVNKPFCEQLSLFLPVFPTRYASL